MKTNVLGERYLFAVLSDRENRFDDVEDEALFMGLLACCLQQIFDGKEIKVDEMTVQ